MIVFTARRILLITPPRCASTTLRAALCRPGGGVPGGTRLPEWVAKHTQYPPPGCEGYAVLLAIRDPVDRALSMHAHGLEIDPDHPSVRSPAAFARSLAGRAEPLPWSGWMLTCSAHLAVNPDLPPRLVGLVRVEHLEADLARHLPAAAPAPLPWWNASIRPRGLGHVCPETVALIREWGRADLDLMARFDPSKGNY